MRSVFLAVQNISVKRDVFHLEPTCNSSLLLGQALRDFFKAHLTTTKKVYDSEGKTVRGESQPSMLAVAAHFVVISIFVTKA